MEGSQFLKKKFPNLHTSEAVTSATQRAETRTEEKISQKPTERIEVYLARFEEILNREDSKEKERERGIEAFKKVLFEQNIIKEEDIPERVYELEQEIAFNRGHGHIDLTEEDKQTKNQEIINGQKNSLSAWVDYLSSNDAMYPMWAKYWVMESVLKAGKYNKEKKTFDKRGKQSVAPFPPMNAGAIAKAIAVLQEKQKKDAINKQKDKSEEKEKVENFSNLSDEEFQKAVGKEDFATLYALALESLPEFSEEGLENIKGEWVIYKQIPYQEDNGERYPEQYPPQVQQLFDSLQGYPLEWCTAQNIDTAHSQLQDGDFHVYYSEDKNGNNKIPRVAIRMEGDHIAEVRGIEAQQEMDRFILPVVEEKMQGFGQEGEVYIKKNEDMQRMTTLSDKYKNGESFTKEDLIFLYEIDSKIRGFAYGTDPRINELRHGRNVEEDMLTIFECTESQVAHTLADITEDTKAYVGSLEPGVLQKLPPDLEHVYISFPDKKICKESMKVGGKSAEKLISEIVASGMHVHHSARNVLLNKKGLSLTENPEDMTFVRLTASDLGFETTTNITQVFKRAKELGFALCPPEAGPSYRLKYRDQHPSNTGLRIGMEPIADSDNESYIFFLAPGLDRSLLLTSTSASPDSKVHPGYEFLFRLS